MKWFGTSRARVRTAIEHACWRAVRAIRGVPRFAVACSSSDTAACHRERPYPGIDLACRGNFGPLSPSPMLLLLSTYCKPTNLYCRGNKEVHRRSSWNISKSLLANQSARQLRCTEHEARVVVSWLRLSRWRKRHCKWCGMSNFFVVCACVLIVVLLNCFV